MNNKNLIIICITAIIIAAIVAGAAYMIMDKQVKTQEPKNITHNNNTTKIANNTTVEKISTDNNQQNNANTEQVEFNGKTHSENVADASASQQCAGMSAEQINSQVSKIEADGGMV